MDNQTTRVVEIGAVTPEEVVSEVLNNVGTTAEHGSNPTEMKKEPSSSSEAKSIYELMEEDIMAPGIPDSEKTKRLCYAVMVMDLQCLSDDPSELALILKRLSDEGITVFDPFASE